MSPPRSTGSVLGLALAATLGLTAGAVAQNTRPPAAPAKAPARAAQPGTAGAAPVAGATALSEELFRLDSVGLSMHLPSGAVAQSTRMGDKEAVQITPAPPDVTWMVNLQTPSSSNPTHTAESVANEVLTQLLATVGIVDRKVDKDGILHENVTSPKGGVLEAVKALDLQGVAPEGRRPAARFYVRLSRGDKEPALVRGYTIFKIQPGRFVTFDLSVTEPQFARVKPIYETMIGTVSFTDPTLVNTSRGTAVQTGVDFITNLTAADYERAIAANKDQFYRVYLPKAGGSDADATEVAYKRVRAWSGMRGQIDPQANPSSFTTGDRQTGYLVRIDSRLVQPVENVTVVADSIATYFMTPDRKEEAWLIQLIVRDPRQRKPLVSREIGGRTGRSMSISDTGANGDTVWKPLVPDIGYTNLVENALLPQLLIGARSAGEHGFYTYRSERTDANKIVLRRDTVAEVADRAGAWQITTRMTEDSAVNTGIYNEHGELVQGTFGADGTIQAPITLQRLADLWRSKGLPMD
jgi:hypothetical protein